MNKQLFATLFAFLAAVIPSEARNLSFIFFRI